MFHEGSEFMYWPRSYRKNPYNLMRGYRGFDDGFFDGGGCGPGGNCGPGPGHWGGDGGFGGIGSFIVGGLAGAFLANTFGSKNAQAAPQPVYPQPVYPQPVPQPIPYQAPMPYGYAPYGYNGPQAAQVQNQQGQKQIITSSTSNEDEELYPDFDEWMKQKQPIKETHNVYTIPSQPVYNQQPTYQPQMMPYQELPYQGGQSGVASYPMPVADRPMTMSMPYYMFPVQQ